MIDTKRNIERGARLSSQGHGFSQTPTSSENHTINNGYQLSSFPSHLTDPQPSIDLQATSSISIHHHANTLSPSLFTPHLAYEPHSATSRATVSFSDEPQFPIPVDRPYFENAAQPYRTKDGTLRNVSREEIRSKTRHVQAPVSS